MTTRRDVRDRIVLMTIEKIKSGLDAETALTRAADEYRKQWEEESRWMAETGDLIRAHYRRCIEHE